MIGGRPVERHLSSDGDLAVIQFKDLDFEPKRVYWLYNTPNGLERGWHAHKALEQYVVCVRGSVEIELDDGTTKTVHRLDDATGGLSIKPGQWRILRGLARDAVVMVLASREYEPGDYIHDYEEFLAWVQRS